MSFRYTKPTFLEHYDDAWRYFTGPRKTLVLILCTMRSGSTLVKALLGNASDVSHLEETKFHDLRTNKYDFYNRFADLATEPIIVLKHPMWFSDTITRFEIPNLKRVRLICLVRDAYETVLSLKAMQAQTRDSRTDAELIEYWCRCTRQIVMKHAESAAKSRLVRYEDVVTGPVEVTRGLFEFIGSKNRQGVDSYTSPDNAEWRWGTDDAGDKIRAKKVIHTEVERSDENLRELLRTSEIVSGLRRKLGYGTVI